MSRKQHVIVLSATMATVAWAAPSGGGARSRRSRGGHPAPIGDRGIGEIPAATRRYRVPAAARRDAVVPRADHRDDRRPGANHRQLRRRIRRGHPLEGVPGIWRKFASISPGAISYAGTHPTTAERFVRLGEIIEEIEAKIRAGEELLPEFE